MSPNKSSLDYIKAIMKEKNFEDDQQLIMFSRVILDTDFKANLRDVDPSIQQRLFNFAKLHIETYEIVNQYNSDSHDSRTQIKSKDYHKLFKDLLLAANIIQPQELPTVFDGQRWFIERMKAVGYDANDAGMCHGLAAMAMQAFLTDQQEVFNQQLQNFHNHPVDDYENEFKKLKLRRQELNERLASDLPDDEKVKVAREEKELRKFITDSYALFDGIAIHQSPTSYLELYLKDASPQAQDYNKSSPVFRSPVLEAEASGAKVPQLGQFLIGNYSRQELEYYLSCIANVMENDISMILGCNQHAINLSLMVDSESHEKKWILNDPNHMPGETYSSSKAVAGQLFEYFVALDDRLIHSEDLPQGITMTSEVFHQTRHSLATKKSFNMLKEDKKFQQIHSGESFYKNYGADGKYVYPILHEQLEWFKEAQPFMTAGEVSKSVYNAIFFNSKKILEYLLSKNVEISDEDIRLAVNKDRYEILNMFLEYDKVSINRLIKFLNKDNTKEERLEQLSKYALEHQKPYLISAYLQAKGLLSDETNIEQMISSSSLSEDKKIQFVNQVIELGNQRKNNISHSEQVIDQSNSMTPSELEFLKQITEFFLKNENNEKIKLRIQEIAQLVEAKNYDKINEIIEDELVFDFTSFKNYDTFICSIPREMMVTPLADKVLSSRVNDNHCSMKLALKSYSIEELMRLYQQKHPYFSDGTFDDFVADSNESEDYQNYLSYLINAKIAKDHTMLSVFDFKAIQALETFFGDTHRYQSFQLDLLTNAMKTPDSVNIGMMMIGLKSVFKFENFDEIENFRSKLPKECQESWLINVLFNENLSNKSLIENAEAIEFIKGYFLENLTPIQKLSLSKALNFPSEQNMDNLKKKLKTNEVFCFKSIEQLESFKKKLPESLKEHALINTLLNENEKNKGLLEPAFSDASTNKIMSMLGESKPQMKSDLENQHQSIKSSGSSSTLQQVADAAGDSQLDPDDIQSSFSLR